MIEIIVVMTNYINDYAVVILDGKLLYHLQFSLIIKHGFLINLRQIFNLKLVTFFWKYLRHIVYFAHSLLLHHPY